MMRFLEFKELDREVAVNATAITELETEKGVVYIKCGNRVHRAYQSGDERLSQFVMWELAEELSTETVISEGTILLDDVIRKATKSYTIWNREDNNDDRSKQ